MMAMCSEIGMFVNRVRKTNYKVCELKLLKRKLWQSAKRKIKREEVIEQMSVRQSSD